jgi:hypothetical protein
VSFRVRFEVCKKIGVLFLHFREGDMFQRERIHEEIKKLEEGQFIWSREVGGRMAKSEIMEVEGSQTMYKLQAM